MRFALGRSGFLKGRKRSKLANGTRRAEPLYSLEPSSRRQKLERHRDFNVSTSSRGSARERQARKLLESEGWAVTRGAGSHGAADLWCAMAKCGCDDPTPVDGRIVPCTRENPCRYGADRLERGIWEDGTRLRLLQIKTDKSSPWANFRPKERRELLALAAQTGGIAELWHWPARGTCQIFFENEWPHDPAATLDGSVPSE